MTTAISSAASSLLYGAKTQFGVGGAASQTGSASGTTGTSSNTSSTSTAADGLAALFNNLMQQLSAAKSPGGAGVATALSGHVGAITTHAHRGHGLGSGSASGADSDKQTSLNQLLQELKLGSSSTNATTASAGASAQSAGSQQRLLGMLQQLVQQGSSIGSASATGSLISAIA